MKVLSGPEGDGPLSNVEVLAWLNDKKFDAGKDSLAEGQVRAPSVIGILAKNVRKFIESSPAANVTISSLKELYEKLEKFNLDDTERIMIANIRPEAYAHLTPLLVDVYTRFDEEQLTDMLRIINETLPKRKAPTKKSEDGEEGEEGEEGAEAESAAVSGAAGASADPPEAANGGGSTPVDDCAPMLDLDEPIGEQGDADAAAGAESTSMQVDTAGRAGLMADISALPAAPAGNAATTADISALPTAPVGNAATTADFSAITQSLPQAGGKASEQGTGSASGADGSGKAGRQGQGDKTGRRKKNDATTDQPAIDAAATDISQL